MNAKKTHDLVVKLNREFYDLQDDYLRAVSFAKRLDLPRDLKNELTQTAFHEIQIYKNLLKKLNDLVELEERDDWRDVWDGKRVKNDL